CEILKLAVPSRPKHRRAPRAARFFAKTAATVEMLLKTHRLPSFDSLTSPQQYRKYMTNDRAFELGRGGSSQCARDLRSHWPRQRVFARPASLRKSRFALLRHFARKKTIRAPLKNLSSRSTRKAKE